MQKITKNCNKGEGCQDKVNDLVNVANTFNSKFGGGGKKADAAPAPAPAPAPAKAPAPKDKPADKPAANKPKCVDKEWVNNHGHNCAIIAKDPHAKGDWIDKNGVRADVACCKFGGGDKE